MPTAAATPDLTREQFLAGVRASGVLTDRQFDKVTGTLTIFQKSARDVAEFLVAGDWLTRFQAELLMHGKTDGFLLGPYVVQEYLAKTASGRAYRAKHRTMSRAVAVLVLKQELTTGEGVREAIRVQARAAARLAHPNLLTLLDVNTAGARMYLVHEYVDGGDVAAVVKRGGPLSVPRACEFVRQAALGLQHAHDKQTPHGRLGPAAVLVGRPGGNGPQDKPVVKVCGLGLGDLTGTDQPAEYAAPELTADPTPNAAADLFALGGVLHLLLTGRPPHPAAPLRTRRNDVPAPLLAVAEAMLSPNPARRPASADVANALAAFASDDSAFIDFTLPAADPHSAAAISGGTATLPVAIPLTATPPPPRPERSPFAELDLADADEVDDADTPVSGRAVYTPVHTVRRKRTTNRRGTRGRKRDGRLAFWLGVIGAVVVLATAAAALAVLAAVIRT
jgi:serine/threonine-protein kinase